MATLAFGLAGAALGGATGIGANTGFLLGSIVGRLLFPVAPVEQRGPRLGDLSVSSSAYGQAIALGYGTFRMAGNMIWSSGIREQENRREVGGGKGGLGGPSQVQITYTYFSSFAMAFAAREAEDVIRIWADSKLIYDKRSTSTTRKAGLNFRFYPGSETQLPDSLIEADKGAGQVPAHRGLCYIVFDDLQLTDFGNRIPNITAEIAFKSTTSNTLRGSNDYTVAEGGLTNVAATDNCAIDRRRRRIYLIDDNVGTPSILRVYNYDTLNEIRQQAVPLISGDAIHGHIHAGQDSGKIYARLGEANSGAIVRIDPNTLAVDAQTSGTVLGNMLQSVEPVAINSLGKKQRFLVIKNDFGLTDNRLALLDADTMTIISGEFAGSTITDSIRGIVAAPPVLGDAVMWACSKAAGNSDLIVWKITIAASASSSTGTLVGVSISQEGTIPSSTWNNDIASTDDVLGPIYDPEDGGLIFAVGVLTSTGTVAFKWRPGDGVVWTSALANTSVPVHIQTFTNSSQVSDGLIGWADSSGLACLLDTRDGTVLVENFDGTTLNGSYNPSGQGFFDGPTQSVVNVKGSTSSTFGLVQQLFLNRATGLGESLDSIVEDISSRVGLDPLSDLSTTELTSDTVRGYAVTRQMEARAAVEPLATAFFFDGVESDDQIMFKKRGRDATRTIADTDLIDISDHTDDVVQESRVQEVELPERISVAYSDIDTDYQQGTQSVKRVRQPVPTMRSYNEQTIGLPIVFTATEAQQIAEKLLFTAWNERTTHSWRAPWEHLDLDPADVVNLTIGSETLRARINKATMNLDFTVSMESATENKITVLSDAVSSGALGVPQKLPPGPAYTKLFLMDIPLLRDVDDTGRVASRLYFAMNGYVDGWTGGALWDSIDGVTFSNTGKKALSGISYGTILNSLPDTTVPDQTDTSTVLEVAMQVGTLSSVTQTQFLNNESAALVGDPDSQNWEIILFKDAVQQSTGNYYVSTIIRARRGTDPQVGTHTFGEFFLLLDRDTVNSLLLDTADVGSLRSYKGVGFDQIVEDADLEPLTSTGADLKPYAPSHLAAALDGSNNIDFSWVRRTRVGGALQDGTGTVPLAEDSESYEVDVKDGPSGTVLRTLTSSSPTVQYANADITTDFGSVPATITFEVFQMSAQVGRGFGREETITL